MNFYLKLVIPGQYTGFLNVISMIILSRCLCVCLWRDRFTYVMYSYNPEAAFMYSITVDTAMTAMDVDFAIW